MIAMIYGFMQNFEHTVNEQNGPRDPDGRIIVQDRSWECSGIGMYHLSSNLNKERVVPGGSMQGDAPAPHGGV